MNVDWPVARRVAARVSGTVATLGVAGEEDLRKELIAATSQAESLVEAETGLVSTAGPARGRVASRAEWVEANLASFDRLLRPLLVGDDSDHAAESKGAVGIGGVDENAGVEDNSGSVDGEQVSNRSSLARQWAQRFEDTVGPMGDRIGAQVAGAEMGAVLGWMSKRVIGQYDLLLIEDEKPEDQDWVYYVGPNIVELERRYGFAPSEFRLWIALHECTHRAQFTGVPWLRPYFISLVNELLNTVDPDPARLIDTAKRVVEQRRSGNSSSLDGGLSMLLATPEQKIVLNKVTGLMSLLEGHGDIIMDRAGADLIPSRPRFARIMSQRRRYASGPSRALQRLLGFDAKLAQYAEGEHFIHAVERAGGRDLFDVVWTSADHLPSIEEVREPALWIERMTG